MRSGPDRTRRITFRGAVAALAVAAAGVRSLPAQQAQGTLLDDLRAERTRGRATAPVTIYEISDFQCPFCAQSTGLLDQVLAAYPKDLRFVYKQFPLEQIHQNAMNAAKASGAAGNQGKFWEMHDELFKISRNLAMDEIRKKAEEIGLDMKKFDADMVSPETEKVVRADLDLGRTVDVQGTPTMFINGKRVMNRSLEGMKAMVDEALKKKG